MRVVDTSAWIEFLLGTPLGRSVRQELPKPAEWVVPTIVQFELSKWLVRELGKDEADSAIAVSQQFVVAPLLTAIAVDAADLSRQYKLPTADAIVYAAARAHDADLLTCDRHFEGLPGVSYLSKRSN